MSYAVRLGTRVVFYNENRTHAPVVAAVSLGRPSDAVYVGDWDGDGRDTLALQRGQRVLLQTDLSSSTTTEGSLADLDKARRQQARQARTEPSGTVPRGTAGTAAAHPSQL